MTPTIHHGDCLEVMAGMPENSVDAIVTDPPYGLGFMGRKWDDLPPGEDWARACLRVLKPGGHLLAFGGTRTWHRLAVAIEDAGFEIRDSIAWMYGSGFPKGQDIGKQIDKKAGATREVVGMIPPSVGGGRSAPSHEGWQRPWMQDPTARDKTRQITTPATPEAEQWSGWNTALKPAFEPIIVARKPLTGTVAANTLKWGVGGINVDACRIGMSEGDRAAYEAKCASVIGLDSNRTGAAYGEWSGARTDSASTAGRWPANVVLDEHAAAELDQQSGYQRDGFHVGRNRDAGEVANTILNPRRKDATDGGYGSGGGASRFFYVAKAPKRERPNVAGVQHPTVKPLALMRWLVRLVTPPGGVVLDPFAGSGTTIEAALQEGFNPVGIEMTDEYLPLIQHRIERNVKAIR